MPIDPMDSVDREDTPADKAASRLNTWVALTVALLATFTGICGIKDNNIGQGMQQAQADKLDHWAFYQARNIREEVDVTTAAQLKLTALSLSGARRQAYDSLAQGYEAMAADQKVKKDSLRTQAEADQANYDALNYRDDQFDLSDALIALAISLLALTALTHKRWLFLVALVPTILGVLMGLSGLLGWHIHPDTITRLLS
jgi:hypothetical protein